MVQKIFIIIKKSEIYKDNNMCIKYNYYGYN